MHTEIEWVARSLGFSRVYYIDPSLEKTGYGLPAFTKTILVLAWAYVPHSIDEPIPAYYLASNSSYHAGNAFVSNLRGMGARTERSHVPVIPLLRNAKIGVMGLNGLLRLKGLGSRTVLTTFVTELCGPLSTEEPCEECGCCSMCARACLTGAITANGVDYKRCIRWHMGTACHPDFVKEMLPGFLGCEICQAVCPKNAIAGTKEPDDDVAKAFDLPRLIRGDASAARLLVGRNQSSNGKLIAEAITLAAKRGVYADAIRAGSDSGFEAVRDAVRWADIILKNRFRI